MPRQPPKFSPKGKNKEEANELRLKVMSNAVDGMKNQRDDALKQKTDAEGKVKELGKKIDDLTEENQVLVGKLNYYESKEDAGFVDPAEYNAVLDGMEETCAARDAAIEEKYAALEEKNAAVKEKNAAETKMAEESDAYASLQRKHDALENDFQSARGALQDCDEKIKQQDANIRNLEQDRKNKISIIEGLEAQLGGNEKKIKQLQDNITRKTKEHEELSAKVGNIEEAVKNHRRDAEHSQKQRHDAEIALKNSQATIKKLQDEIEKRPSDEELEQLNRLIADLNQQVTDTAIQIAELEALNAELKAGPRESRLDLARESSHELLAGKALSSDTSRQLENLADQSSSDEDIVSDAATHQPAKYDIFKHGSDARTESTDLAKKGHKGHQKGKNVKKDKIATSTTQHTGTSDGRKSLTTTGTQTDIDTLNAATQTPSGRQVHTGSQTEIDTSDASSQTRIATSEAGVQTIQSLTTIAGTQSIPITGVAVGTQTLSINQSQTGTQTEDIASGSRAETPIETSEAETQTIPISIVSPETPAIPISIDLVDSDSGDLLPVLYIPPESRLIDPLKQWFKVYSSLWIIFNNWLSTRLPSAIRSRIPSRNHHGSESGNDAPVAPAESVFISEYNDNPYRPLKVAEETQPLFWPNFLAFLLHMVLYALIASCLWEYLELHQERSIWLASNELTRLYAFQLRQRSYSGHTLGLFFNAFGRNNWLEELRYGLNNWLALDRSFPG